MFISEWNRCLRRCWALRELFVPFSDLHPQVFWGADGGNSVAELRIAKKPLFGRPGGQHSMRSEAQSQCCAPKHPPEPPPGQPPSSEPRPGREQRPRPGRAAGATSSPLPAAKSSSNSSPPLTLTPSPGIPSSAPPPQARGLPRTALRARPARLHPQSSSFAPGTGGFIWRRGGRR